MREQSFELWEDGLRGLGGFGRHLANLRELTGGTIKPNPLGGLPPTLSRAPGPRPPATLRAARPPRPPPAAPRARTAARR
ncbi:hypothetical protein CTZ28_08845 [Streptomyces shenzhenensis]|uniref:Uncharacterized protein n=1 Tax=Streptomyces shenzhenensis TaxID=943815 RepID=A0A3M0I9X7_9ACTN|nr:hypothetical protein CTZ28_08845 [Streptomyces shenzhenensis]